MPDMAYSRQKNEPCTLPPLKPKVVNKLELPTGTTNPKRDSNLFATYRRWSCSKGEENAELGSTSGKVQRLYRSWFRTLMKQEPLLHFTPFKSRVSSVAKCPVLHLSSTLQFIIPDFHPFHITLYERTCSYSCDELNYMFILNRTLECEV